MESYFLSSLSGDLQSGRTEQNEKKNQKTKKINKQKTETMKNN